MVKGLEHNMLPENTPAITHLYIWINVAKRNNKRKFDSIVR